MLCLLYLLLRKIKNYPVCKCKANMQFSKEHHLRCLLLSFLVFLMLVPALEIRDSVDGVKSFSPSVYSQFSYLQSTIYTETVVTVTYTGITTYSYEIGPSGIGKPIPSSKLSESLLPQFSRSPGGVCPSYSRIIHDKICLYPKH